MFFGPAALSTGWRALVYRCRVKLVSFFPQKIGDKGLGGGGGRTRGGGVSNPAQEIYVCVSSSFQHFFTLDQASSALQVKHTKNMKLRERDTHIHLYK